MDQIKIGKFIAECRKQKSLTQMQLAEKLGITDKAVSKWERGHNCPDILIVDELAKAFGVTIEELFLFDDDKKQKSTKCYVKLSNISCFFIFFGIVFSG